MQKPIINKYITIIKKNISDIINIKQQNISIKATTTDYLGFIGKEQGVCALAVVLIQKGKKCQKSN